MTPDLSGQPLANLKQWLAIGAAGEDALLLRLLDTAWQICARFTGHGAAEWSALDEALRHDKVRLIANALGTPPPQAIEKAHAQGVKMAALCGKVKQAIRGDLS